MYIKEIIIENIRAVAKLEMKFPQPAGWHVLIGDNASGKSSVLQAIALVLTPLDQRATLRRPPEFWMKKGKSSCAVILKISRDARYDGEPESEDTVDLDNLEGYRVFMKTRNVKLKDGVTEKNLEDGVMQMKFFGNKEPIEGKSNEGYGEWGENGWFSVGFGPFRRFVGGNTDTERLSKNFPKLTAHLSLFGEEFALVEALEWIKELDYKRLKELETPNNGKEFTYTYHNLIKFVNQSKLLPHGVEVAGIDKDGIQFKDGNGNQIDTLELSDGYRSILSLTFELLRQLIVTYGTKLVFQEIERDNMYIDLPGVVLIDEVDAHLHPSWQTEIGRWFLQYFPSLQFIVTTHSPLVCRACEHGSIWRLSPPGSGQPSTEIVGVERDRLIYGNILDAYGTEIFGSSPARSEQSNEKLKRLGQLNIRAALGKIKPEEETERLELEKIFTTDAPTGF